MKLTKKQLEKICKEYDLGKIKSIKAILDGWVNFNFDLKTDKGRYIIQILGNELNPWKMHKLKLQFKLLKYLKENDFPYKIPEPILNSKKKELLMMSGRGVWVYERIEGDAPKSKITLRQYREIAKALALFHKYTKNFKATGIDEKREVDILFKRYKKMSKINPANKTDKIMLDNLDFFVNALESVKDAHERGSRVLHGDLGQGNVLFDGDKVTGIIDFDNVNMRPIGRDIILSIERCDYKRRGVYDDKIQIFLREYRKYNRFPKNKERNLIIMKLRNNCSVFWWFYEGMKKNHDKRYQSLYWLTEESKVLMGKLK